MIPEPTEKESESGQKAVETTHLLLVNLGLGQEKAGPLGYAPTTYIMPDGKSYPTSFAGFALWQWLEDTERSPEAVVFACTETAWGEKHQTIEDSAAALGLDVARISDPVFLNIPKSLDDVWAMVQPLEDWLRRHGDGRSPLLHMDLTHAYRAIPLAHLLIAMYFQERGLSRIGVCGYGAYERGQSETPYIDLSHLLHLAQWAQAVRAFRERFDTSGLAALLGQYEREASFEVAQMGSTPPPEVRRVVKAARLAGPFFAAGLPLELGIKVRKTLANTTREDVDRAAKQLVAAHRSLVLELFDVLNPIAPAQVAKTSAKEALPLNDEEITRELRLLHHWLEAGLPERALLVLREVVINRVLLALRPQGWLERSTRMAVEEALNEFAWNEACQRPQTPELQTLRSVWREIASRRNPLAHAGMQHNDVDVGQLDGAVRELLKKVEDLLPKDEPWVELARLVNNSQGTHEDKPEP